MSEEAYRYSTNDASPEEIHAFLDQCANANVYQYSAYGEVHYGGDALEHFVVRSGGRLIGYALVRIVSIPLLGSVMAYVYRGPVWRESEEDPERAAKILKSMADYYVKDRKLLLAVIPRLEDTVENRRLLTTAGFRRNPKVRQYTTRYQHLEWDEERLYADLSKKWKGNLRRGKRGDWDIIESSGAEDLQTFVTIYRQMVNRKKFVELISIEKMVEAQHRLPDHAKLKVLLCREAEGRISSGILFTDAGDTVIPLFSCTANEYLKLRRSYLLRWELLLRSARKGLRFFDQGGLNRERNPGGFHFKDGMGGRDVIYLGQYEKSPGIVMLGLFHLALAVKRKRIAMYDKLSKLKSSLE